MKSFSSLLLACITSVAALVAVPAGAEPVAKLVTEQSQIAFISSQNFSFNFDISLILCMTSCPGSLFKDVSVVGGTSSETVSQSSDAKAFLTVEALITLSPISFLGII